jgi:hypothetical protein
MFHLKNMCTWTYIYFINMKKILHSKRCKVIKNFHELGYTSTSELLCEQYSEWYSRNRRLLPPARFSHLANLSWTKQDVEMVILRGTFSQRSQRQWLCRRNTDGSSVPSLRAETAVQFQRALPGGSTDKSPLRIVMKSTCRWYRYLGRGLSYNTTTKKNRIPSKLEIYRNNISASTWKEISQAYGFLRYYLCLNIIVCGLCKTMSTAQNI